jgi:hypothetical protein
MDCPGALARGARHPTATGFSQKSIRPDPKNRLRIDVVTDKSASGEMGEWTEAVFG